MEIKIEVSDDMFTELAEKELKALTPEQLQEVILNGISKSLEANDYKLVNDLLFERGISYSSKDFTSLAKQMVASADYSKLQGVVDKCIEEIQTNYRNILIDILTNSLVSGLMNSYELYQRLSDSVRAEVYNTLNDMKH